MEMSNCVCGTYIKFPVDKNIRTPQIQHISFDLVIQVDDLLCWSSAKYMPRFLTGDLELEISPNITQNMVFCQIPFDVHTMFNGDDLKLTADKYQAINLHTKKYGDFRFHQCGDYAKCGLSYLESNDADPQVTGDYFATINVSNLEVIEAKSYVHGFNIKDTAKQNIENMFANKRFTLPCQWCEWYSMSQLNNTNNIKCNIQVPMFNATQIVFTFPNSSNQLTVSRNPHLESVQCHISDRILPDKFLNTLEPAFSEMVLTALGLDTLFSADDSLIESLTRNRGKYTTYTLKHKTDDDFMMIFDLERTGAHCVLDGMNGINVPINLQANYMEGVENPHYYRREYMSLDAKEFLQANINLFVISDAFWVYENGSWQFIKE